jgi:hypothetical protein
MKLTSDDVKGLIAAIDACMVGGVKDVIVDEGYIYGTHPNRAFALISNFNIPNLGQKAGFSEIGLLRNILDSKDGDVAVETEETDRGEIRTVIAKRGRAKLEYRCTSTSLLKPARKFNDEVYVTLEIDKAGMAEIMRLASLVKPSKITLSVKANGAVSFQGTGAGGNNFVYDIEAKAKFTDEDDKTTVVFHYIPDVFSSIMKEMNSLYDTYNLGVGELGTISGQLSGHNFIMLPFIEEDDL